MDKRLIDAKIEKEDIMDQNIRPEYLNEYVGQDEIKNNLKVFIEAAKMRNEGKNKSIKIDLPPFTLIGATTKAGNLSSPLRDRFGIVCKLEYYNQQELENIVKRTSRVFDMGIDDDAATVIASRSRKTPRIANRLFKRVRDFALVEGDGYITRELADNSLNRLKVNSLGLDHIDIEYLTSLVNKFNGGPVGVETLATSIGEENSTLEDVIEPYLLQEGFIKRTRSGRVATEKTYELIEGSD